MYESCLAVGTIAADDRDSLADVSFDPLTVAYDDDEEEDDDTKGEEANEDADEPPRLATRPSKLPAKLPRYVRTPRTFEDADDTDPFLRPTFWWFFHPCVFTAPEWHSHAARRR